MVHRLVELPVNRRRSLASRMHDDEQGLILVFVVIMMAVLLGVLAIVVDIGNARQQRRQAQTASDASALVAAETLESFGPGFSGAPSQWTTVVQQVKGYAKQNFGVQASDWVGCSDVSALTYRPDAANSNSCISADFSLWSAPLPGDPINTVNRIRVRLPQRTIKTFFGSVLGANTLSTGATSMSSITRTTHTIVTSLDVATPGGPCALCILSPTGLTLDGQNGDVTIAGGGVTVNSTSSTAASLNPNGHVKITLPCDNSTTPPTCNTIGGPNAPANFSGNGFSPTPVHKDPVPDPLAALPQCGTGRLGDGTIGTPPPTSVCPTNVVNTQAKNLPFELTPGIYKNGFENSHHLAPGTYILMDDIVLNGNDQITGDGVTLYFACGNYLTPAYSDCPAGTTGAGIKTTGNGAKNATDNGSLRLTGPTSGPFKGLVMFSDRNNTSTLTFRGNGSNESGPQSGSSGTIYAKGGTLDLRGNGYTLASMIIVNNFTMKGNPSAVTVAYDLSKNYYVETHHTETSTATSYSYDANGLIQ
ncbi:MAG TPA: Tad domain-containing protein [Acidimicrobiia bacterium]|nr:Tad domain-containing protein [Acidimicrobiia bacterium]